MGTKSYTETERAEMIERIKTLQSVGTPDGKICEIVGIAYKTLDAWRERYGIPAGVPRLRGRTLGAKNKRRANRARRENGTYLPKETKAAVTFTTSATRSLWTALQEFVAKIAEPTPSQLVELIKAVRLIESVNTAAPVTTTTVTHPVARAGSILRQVENENGEHRDVA